MKLRSPCYTNTIETYGTRAALHIELALKYKLTHPVFNKGNPDSL